MPSKQNVKAQQRQRSERAAAAQRERQRRERRRQLLTVVAVVVVIALVVGGGFLVHSLRGHGSPQAAKKIPGPGSTYGLTIGPKTAPHQVVVYEDFLSPDSGTFEKDTETQLAQLATSGKVRVEYRPFIATTDGEYSERATLIWWLVRKRNGDGAAEKFHDLLYAHQPKMAGPYPSRDDLYQLAAQAGADAAQLKKDVEAEDGVDAVADGTKSAKDLGIKTAPTVVLDGKVFESGTSAGDLAQNLLKAVQ